MVEATGRAGPSQAKGHLAVEALIFLAVHQALARPKFGLPPQVIAALAGMLRAKGR